MIFYNVKDSLVFFTLIMLAAEKYKVDISGLCLMYNHYHLDFEADGVSVPRFVKAYSSRFSRNTTHDMD